VILSQRRRRVVASRVHDDRDSRKTTDTTLRHFRGFDSSLSATFHAAGLSIAAMNVFGLKSAGGGFTLRVTASG